MRTRLRVGLRRVLIAPSQARSEKPKPIQSQYFQRNRKTLSADLLAIGKRCTAHGRRDDTEHGELLYDERGLPR